MRFSPVLDDFCFFCLSSCGFDTAKGVAYSTTDVACEFIFPYIFSPHFISLYEN